MPKIVDKENMRGRILDAALKVFARTGYHAATMADVAAELGVAKGTLYLYFRSREALAEAMVERHFSDLEARISNDPRCETLQSFAEQIARTMDVPADQAQFVPIFFEVFGPSFGSDAFAQKVAAFFERLGKHYAGQIAHLQARGEVGPEHDADLLGRALASMVDGMILHRGLFAIPENRNKGLIVSAVAALVLGLRPETSG
ncbi:TetR family transcriptional regulator [Aliiruegeria haliotis]|uniref:TetR family transcriptional regulator n=1 Tax=Aliiruegeria haliotis TaxID=1280846 RepID=A0A2T0RGG5_9RHOB|nr:TetR/AcrR family transcriptional regulator [Aliiruegeria haliotis]PRY20263.1 TetR family transcriptional regulator [Aliiruegeria haliotis]